MKRQRLLELAGLTEAKLSRVQMVKNIKAIAGESDFTGDELVVKAVEFMDDATLRKYYDSQYASGAEGL